MSFGSTGKILFEAGEKIFKGSSTNKTVPASTDGGSGDAPAVPKEDAELNVEQSDRSTSKKNSRVDKRIRATSR